MIIAISGKKQSGKDTTGKILQILLNNPHLNNEGVLSFMKRDAYPDNPYHKSWQIKKFADKLKDIVCLLIGCTREQLEDQEFKEKELGEEWWYWILSNDTRIDFSHLNNGELEKQSTLVKSTPRLLLQLLGTECGRQIIHPNIWVNALMSEYKLPFNNPAYKEYLPDWIITDMRFPNELKAVKDKEGITIRVNRDTEYLKCIEDPAYFVETYMKVNNEKIELREYEKDFIREHCKPTKEHESETALDNAEFDYVIENNGSLEELINKVREILAEQKQIL